MKLKPMCVQFNFPLTGSQNAYGLSNVTWLRGSLSEGTSEWKEIVVLADCDWNIFGKFYSNIWPREIISRPLMGLEAVCVSEGPWSLSSISFIVYLHPDWTGGIIFIKQEHLVYLCCCSHSTRRNNSHYAQNVQLNETQEHPFIHNPSASLWS